MTASDLKDEKGVETVAAPLPSPVAETVAESGSANDGIDEELALAGLAGLLGLGAIGGAIAFTRRRKTRPAATKGMTPSMKRVETPVVEREPVMPEPAVAAPATMPAAFKAETRRPVERNKVRAVAGSSLLDQIDYSKPAGYYASTVDTGPTPINPFLTRKHRLRRAHFLDRQLERAGDRRTPNRSAEMPRVRELEPA